MSAQMKSRLKFPCDCISSTPSCEEPWAAVAKEGMFKDGTKEQILNIVHRQPSTVAQMAKATGLSQPTILRHVAEMVEDGLLSELAKEVKEYSFERYYKPGFPVVARHDQVLLDPEIENIAVEQAAQLARRLEGLRPLYGKTQAASEGWEFEEFAHYLFHSILRETRKKLEEQGLLETASRQPIGFIFWGAE